MKAHELDTRCDHGADVNAAMDWARADRPNVAVKRVDVAFPIWLVDRLDRESARVGVTRQALIKLRIADRLEN